MGARHHFVPKFLLRHFASDARRRQVNVFNMERPAAIRDAPLRHQCYRQDFYGSEEIERSLSQIETIAAPRLRLAVASDDLGGLRPGVRHDILSFLAIQSARTPVSVEALFEGIDQLWKAVLEEDPTVPEEVRSHLSSVTLTHKNPAGYALGILAQSLPTVLDLKLHVFKNATRLPLVLGDNPVVAYNRYAEDDQARSSVGLASRGLQLFLPVDPQSVILAYDAGVYRIGSGRRTVTTLDEEYDVRALNSLQVIAATQNIYFQDWDHAGYVGEELRRVEPFRRELGQLVQKYYDSENSTSRKGVLFHLARPQLRIRLDCRPIRVTRRASRVPVEARGSLVRDPTLLGLVRLFSQQVKAGRHRPSEWNQFLRDNPPSSFGLSHG